MRPFVWCCVFFVCTASAQIEVRKESLSGGIYRLTVANAGYAYSIDPRTRMLRFTTDEPSDVASFTLPQRELLIAVPPGTAPAYSYRITGQRTIENVLPGTVRAARKVNDSLVTYDIVSAQVIAAHPSIRFNGYLWSGNAYCMHFTILPYGMQTGSRTMSEVTEIVIDIPMTGVQRNTAGVKNPSIDNPQYGSGWLVTRPSFPTAATDSWIDYNAEYVKLGVTRDAVYRLTSTDLQNYGIAVGSIVPSKLKLYMAGKEQPIYIFGGADGTFDAGDYIEFLGRRNYGDVRYRQVPPYGQSYYEYLNRYSDTTVYWLNWSGGVGKRIDTLIAVVGPEVDTVAYHDQLLHTENNNFWDFSLNPNPGGAVRREEPELYENETWLEGNIGVGKRPVTFSISKLVSGRPARAFVKLQDYSSSIDADAHRVALSINSGTTLYDSVSVAKYEQRTFTASFSSSLLTNGNNTVNINSYATANTVNQLISDWYELEYPRQLATVGDSLVFAYRSPVTAPVSLVRLTGVTGTGMILYRFNGADSSCVKITNTIQRNDTLLFTDSLKAGNSYFLISAAKTSRPVFFYKKQFVNLRSASRGADYIAITHPYFLPSAGPYLTFVQNQYGVKTALVNINDIYDEFNYGFFAPEPIRDFLKSAYSNWKAPAPRFVFLMGKATYDFYGNKTKTSGVPRLENFVPSYGNPVSDYWFVIWDTTGANIPMMSIGRVPAKTVDEFNIYSLRHQQYVTKGYDDWNKQYLFFSGGSSTSITEITQARSANEAVMNGYVLPRPIGGNAVSFYKTINPTTNFGPYTTAFYNNAVQQGSVFISYIGHSGTQTWDNSIADVTQLSNIRDRNPLVTDFGCSTAKHAEPNVFSFSELFTVDAKSQAIIYIGNSSLGFTSTAYSFPTYFYKKLLVDTIVSVGESHRLAKIDFMKVFGATSSYRLFTLTNTIIGDPIVQLPIPSKPNFSTGRSQMMFTPERPTETDDSIAVVFLYHNLGKAPQDSVTVTWKDEYQGATIAQRTIRLLIPLYADTLKFRVPVKGRPGEHQLTITLDSPGAVSELYENDNTFTSTVVVASSLLRAFSLSPTLSQTTGTVRFLNPAAVPPSSTVSVSVSENEDLSSAQTVTVPLDTFSTAITIPGSFSGKRVWLRPKFTGSSTEGLKYSYLSGTKDNVVFQDAYALDRLAVSNMRRNGSTVSLDTSVVTFSAISAGANAGATAVVSRNGLNLTPSSNLTGHHVGVFDTLTYSLVYFNRYNMVAGGANITNYENLLDTLSGRYLLVIAVCNDGYSNMSAKLRTSLKSFGSRYIDSLTGPYSWSFIGRKGASSASVKEAFSKLNGNVGRVQSDTSFRIPNTSGQFSSETIGPVESWSSFEPSVTVPGTSSLTVGVIGVKKDNTTDTLIALRTADPVIDLSAIDAVQYPSVRVFGRLTAGSNNVSPSLNGFALNYRSLAELGTNYQVFNAYRMTNNVPGALLTSTDTVVQGSKVQIRYRVYNAGGSTAKNVGLNLTAVWDNNSVEQIASQILDSIPAGSYKEITSVYSTSLGSGRRTIRLSIDPDTTIREIFRDNNVFTIPLIIKKSAGNPVLPNLAIGQNSISTSPASITEENDSVQFTIVYANTGALSNDSVSIRIIHSAQSTPLGTRIIRRKYPLAYDTIRVKFPVVSSGSHQLSVELDHTGLILESSEADNRADYFFTVATTEFNVIAPRSGSISYVDKIVFLNPTSLPSGNPTLVLQVDTASAFTSAAQFTSALHPFATSFALPGLKRSQRYHWRIKFQGGTRDWTVGSFYSGDSSRASLGQLDAAAWNANRFVRIAYSSDSGARIVDTRYAIAARSSGFSDGNNGSITVNGTNVVAPILGSGHNVVVLDTTSFGVVKRQRFDLVSDPANADSLAAFIGSVANGLFVVDVVVDEGSNNLIPSAKNALKSIGSAQIDKLAFNDSWAIIGRKGAAAGSVPEFYAPQGTGSASADTTVVRPERSGTIETPLLGPFTTLSDLKLSAVIPSGSQLTVQFVGKKANGTYDTLITAVNQLTIPLSGVDTKVYNDGKLIFRLAAVGTLRTKRTAPAVTGSPVLNSWRIDAEQGTELAVSSTSSTIDRNQVMEGELIQFSGRIFNVSVTNADSVLVRLKTNASGIDNIVKQQRFTRIASGDSVSFAYTYDTRGKRGNHAFIFEVDPLDSLIENTRTNNTVSIPYIVVPDTVRPVVSVTFDGLPVMDGDFVSRRPEIVVRFQDNNPTNLLLSDTTHFIIKLNNAVVPFRPGTAELHTPAPGRADVRWTPTLADGENIIQITAKDVSENSSDTILMYVNVSSEFRILDLYNMPNPFVNGTHFTFNLTSAPDGVVIKIFTVTGRLIQQIETDGHAGFNNIPWDGRDRDGDEIGNGVYLYKVIVRQSGKQVEGLSKLVRMR